MSYLEELLPEFRKGAKIRIKKWEKGKYYILKNGEVVNQDNEKIVRFYPEAILIDQWELYKELEPDWDSIIKNKCLCYFWDEREEYKIAGILTEVIDNSVFGFTMKNVAGEDVSYMNCRPVRRDEVTFYEDRENA